VRRQAMDVALVWEREFMAFSSIGRVWPDR
jgi:hypothetical protein